MGVEPKPIALVSMPSLSARHPSFQLGLLKPLLERAGFPAQQFSLFMYLGNQVGWRMAETLADVWPCLVGEWIWSKAAFGAKAGHDHDKYFAAYQNLFQTICTTAGCSLADIGSALNPECQIDSIAQSWSVLSGGGDAQRSRIAMNALDKYVVDRSHGLVKLLTPPFDKSDLDPGYRRLLICSTFRKQFLADD
jgi:glycosyl hydrolase family 36